MSTDPGRPHRHALGVDFGTSNTVAVARWPDGRARPILVDGSPLLPSAVYAEPDGQLIVGRDAVHSARLEPARYEPNPKRRIDDGTVLLGDREVPVVELFAAVLGRVAEEWRRAAGPVPTDVTLTCPATWGAARRTLLAQAAARAGFAGARLVAEPVAAATYFAGVLGRDVPIGSVVMVHDFGAGTFDATVVARTADGFEVMAVDGRDDIGGLDVDAAVVDHLGGVLGAGPEADGWRRLTEPTSVAERRAQRELWDDVRVAKERLSRTQSADLVVPLVNREIHLTRGELEQLARPVLEETVQVTRSLLRWADLPEGRLAGVFLVGGASRIPLVATLLHRALGEAPVVIEQPELVVAEGSILADAALLAGAPAAPGPTEELRLAAALRAQSETVRVARLRPAAVPVDEQDTVPSRRGGYAPPPVDPWPDATSSWPRDPDATVTTEPAWPVSAPRPVSPARPVSPRPVSPRPVSPHPVSPPPTGRPVSPAQPHAAARPVSPPGPGRPTRSGNTAQWRPAPPPRRPGRVVRFLQIALSVVVLIAVPLAAMLLAYGYGNGLSIQEDAVHLARDLAQLARGRGW
jgi:molecular chaperone DnaK